MASSLVRTFPLRIAGALSLSVPTTTRTTALFPRILHRNAFRRHHGTSPISQYTSVKRRGPPWSTDISTERQHSTSSVASSPTSFADPDRSDLFYHLMRLDHASSPVFALSFLPHPPSSVDSATIIGWLPAGEEADGGYAGLNDFQQNPKFIETLHEAILSGLRDGVDEIQINIAMQIQQGWMHIHDNRNVPALGRIGDVDDILGSVLVEDSVILADTYQPMPSYRLCTADGVLQLTEGLAQRLSELLKERDIAERRQRAP